MLVITRRLGQSVYVGPDARLTVLAVEGNKVRLGFSAPPQVRIDREEARGRGRPREFAEKSPPAFEVTHG